MIRLILKYLTGILLTILFNLSNLNAQHTYLLDSVTTILLFGGTFSHVISTKYHYDENYRLSVESSLDYKIEYEYFNEFDYSKSYLDLEKNTIEWRKSYFHDNEGYLIEVFFEEFDIIKAALIPSSKQLIEYDENQRVKKYQQFTIDDSGTERIFQDKNYSYNEYGIDEEFFISYLPNSTTINFTNTIIHQYENGLINSVFTEKKYADQTSNTSEKEYLYQEGLLVSRETTHFVNNQFENASLILYENTDHGIFLNQFYKDSDTTDYLEKSILYKSEYITPFFDQDTFISTSQFGNQIIDDRRIINSVHYTTKEDTALVIKDERRIMEFDLSERIQISKEIHIRINEEVDSLYEQEIFADVFPNPTNVSGFINIKLIDSTINKYEIFNTIGQRIELGPIWSENMQIKSPDVPGQYYIRFFQDHQIKGKIISFSVF